MLLLLLVSFLISTIDDAAAAYYMLRNLYSVYLSFTFFCVYFYTRAERRAAGYMFYLCFINNGHKEFIILIETYRQKRQSWVPLRFDLVLGAVDEIAYVVAHSAQLKTCFGILQLRL